MQKPARGTTVKNCLTEEDGFSLVSRAQKVVGEGIGFPRLVGIVLKVFRPLIQQSAKGQ